MEELVKKRTKERRNLTLRVNKLKEIYDYGDSVNVDQLIFHIAKTKEVKGQLENIDEQVGEELSEEELERYSDRVEELLFLAERLVKRLEKPDEVPETPSKHRNAAISVKLPKIELPTFSGDVAMWTTYWDNFDAVINNNDSLNPVQKFSYLLSSLKGVAKETVSGFKLTNANYNVAVSILKRRFGRREVIIRSHVKQLLRLDDVENNAKSLRKFYDVVEVQLRSLEMLQVSTDDFALFVEPIILNKLPEELVLCWNRKVGDAEDEEGKRLVALRDFILSEAEHFEEVEDVKNKFVGASKVNRSIPHQRHVKVSTFVSKADYQGLIREIEELPVGKRLGRVKELKLCFRCLGYGHNSRACRSIYKCRECHQNHHSSLHGEFYKSGTTTGDNKQDSPVRVNTAVNTTVTTKVKRVLLQTALIKVKGCDRLVRVLLDSGAETSYVSSGLVKELGLTPIESCHFQPESFGGYLSAMSLFDRVEIQFCNRFQEGNFLLKCWVVPQICSPLPSLDAKYMADLPVQKLAETFEGEELVIDILLGFDALPSILGTQDAPIHHKGFLLVNSVLGWVIGGRYPDGLAQRSSIVPLIRVLRVSSLNGAESSKILWELESMGIPKRDLDPDEFNINPVLVNRRYEISLPWVDDERPTFSIKQARKRNRHFLALTEAQQQEYEMSLEEWLRLGIIEDSVEDGGSFLPHHGVISSHKFRVVFDGSAEGMTGHSINDLLLTGPNLIQDLLSVLLRFRFFTAGVSADITKAFLMIGINPVDRKFLKILWFRKGVETISQFARLPFGLNCSSAVLQVVLKLHLSTLGGDKVASSLQAGMYVDDVLSGVMDVTKVSAFRDRAEVIFQLIGMSLHKWRTSHPPVGLECQWDASDNKVLGVAWDPLLDSLKVDLRVMLNKPIHSRRELLSVFSSVFDPLGLVAPFLLIFKLIFQELWSQSLSWDDTIPEVYEAKIETASAEINQTPVISVLRRVPKPSSLHCFVDASDRAYSAVLYVCEESGDSSLLFARVKLAPLKPRLSVPRLELMAALLGVRMMQQLLTHLPDLLQYPIWFWSDSAIVLAWLKRGPEPWRLFVRNRVKEIIAFRPHSCWHKVDGKVNPADLATRGISLSSLSASKLWWKGPLFLRNPKSDMFVEVEEEIECVDELPECRRKVLLILTEMKPLFDLHRYGSLKRVKRVAAWVIRAKDAFCKGVVYDLNTPNQEELKRGFCLLLREEQIRYYSREIGLLDEGRVPADSPLQALHLLWVENLLLAKPRNGESCLPVLSNKSKLFELVVWDVHYSLFHAGVSSVVFEIRQMLCIPKLRSSVKKILFTCIRCKRFQGRPFKVEEGSLPLYRVQPGQPFLHSGVDFCGPFVPSEGFKCYVLVFTCSVTRALHLEVTKSLSTEATLNAVCKFRARRGVPSAKFLSDNGSSFIKLQKILDGHVEWVTIPPEAPWFGGYWERLVGLLKRCLQKTFGKLALSYDNFCTVILQVEMILNRRPLCPQESQVEEALTPAHFLIGSSLPPLLDVAISTRKLQVSPGQTQMLKQFRARQRALQHFWKRYVVEYLPTLRCWRKGMDKWGAKSFPKEGDLVLVKTTSPRGSWPLARIEKLVEGSDGNSRTAWVVLRGRRTRRPMAHLFPLEVRVGEDFLQTSYKETKPPEKVTRTGRVIKTPIRYQT